MIGGGDEENQEEDPEAESGNKLGHANPPPGHPDHNPLQAP